MSLIPMISMRGFVTFPGTVNLIMVGRPFTIASLKKALESFDGKIVLTAQRSVEMNERPEEDELFRVGCLCKIVKHIEFPDGTMKLVIEAEHRFNVKKIIDADDIRYCEGEILEKMPTNFEVDSPIRNSLLEKLSANKKDWNYDVRPQIEKLISTREGYSFLMGVAGLIAKRSSTQKELTLEQIREGLFIVDTLTKEEKEGINLETARLQEVLETMDVKSAVKKIRALL